MKGHWPTRCESAGSGLLLLQAGKVYVQNRLAETGQQVWDLLQQGAHFYVCGDAAHMATAVEEALLDIICQYQVLHCLGDAHPFIQKPLMQSLVQPSQRKQ